MPAISEQTDPQPCDEIQLATNYLVTSWRALSPLEREILTTLVNRWLASAPRAPCHLRLVPPLTDR